MDLPAAVQAVFKELRHGRYAETFHEAIPSLLNAVRARCPAHPASPRPYTSINNFVEVKEFVAELLKSLTGAQLQQTQTTDNLLVSN